MQLAFNGLVRPKTAARNLKKAYNIKLSEAQTFVARLAGYRDWHELERSGASPTPSLLDNQLPERERDQRRMRLIERLQAVTGRSFMEAGRGLLAAQLLHQNREDPIRSIRDDGSFQVGQTVSLDGTAKGIVLDAASAVQVLKADGGLALRGREEVSAVEPDANLRLPARLWVAYGMWREPTGALVLFSRDYCPLWRIRGKTVERAAPDEWIDYSEQKWFWNDSTHRPWGRDDRIEEEAQRLRSYGVDSAPLLKWALLPLLFDRRVQRTDNAIEIIKRTRPWDGKSIAA